MIIDDSHKITGIVSDVGDWIGDKRTKYYSRAEFKTSLIRQEKLRFTKKLELQVKDVDFEEYTWRCCMNTARSFMQQDFLNKIHK